MNNLFLNGVVGEDILLSDVLNFLSNSSSEEVTIFINSPGGSVPEGVSIYNVLKNSNKIVHTVVLGMCYSIATIIFLGGSKRSAMDGTLFMMHKPSTIAIGTSKEFSQAIDVLDITQESLEKIVKKHTNIENVHELFEQEKFLNTKQMKELGITNTEEKIMIGSENDMSVLEDLKKELENVQNINKELTEKKEELELQNQINELKIKNQELEKTVETETETVETEKAEPETVETEKVETEKVETEKVETEKVETETETAETDKQKQTKIIDTTKTEVENKNTIPVFMSSKQKY